MIDLDSNPTKLLDIVEIGKEILITRGALTTFSIANDVAKYFAIIPAIFAVTYPELGILNVMRLTNPSTAVLSAVIFNALIIPALIPLALRGVKYRFTSVSYLLQRNFFIYGLGGILLPFIGIKLIDLLIAISGVGVGGYGMKQVRIALLMMLMMTLLLGVMYPLMMTGIAQLAFSNKANGSLARVGGRTAGSELIGQSFTGPGYFHGRPSADNYDGTNSGGSNFGPTNRKLIDSGGDARGSGAQRKRACARREGSRRPRPRVRQRPRSAHQPCIGPPAGAPHRPRERHRRARG